jgi:hypothetical protein
LFARASPRGVIVALISDIDHLTTSIFISFYYFIFYFFIFPPTSVSGRILRHPLLFWHCLPLWASSILVVWRGVDGSVCILGYSANNLRLEWQFGGFKFDMSA